MAKSLDTPRNRDYSDSMSENVFTAEEIEAQARAAGLSVAELCRRAGVAASSFYRWKADECGITLGSYAKFLDTITAAQAASASAA